MKKHAIARIVNGFDTEKPLPYQLQIVASEELEEFGLEGSYCGASLISPNYAVTGYHCFSLMKDIDNGHPNDKGKVWPSDKKILDFVIVVAGSYFRYEKDTPSEFEIQVSHKINPTSVKLERLKEEIC